MDQNLFYWYWFVNIAGIGLRTCNELMNCFGEPASVYRAGEKELGEFLRPGQVKALLESKDPDKVNALYRRMREANAGFLHRENDLFPAKLKHIFDPPLALYYKGKFPDFNRPVLAVVGSRKATNYGLEMARYFSAAIAEKGVFIISGLAAGIDARSHLGALDVHGSTAAVLGGGIDTVYPRDHFSLYLRMYEEGCVLSEYNVGIPNARGLFPMRNRIISGLSDAVLVVEAGEKSGSLITASLGLDQGKEIFVLPGRVTDPMSKGCNMLLSQGAVPALNPEVILDYLGVSDRIDSKSDDCSKGAEKAEEPDGRNLVLDALDEADPISYEKLLLTTGLQEEELTHILISLELEERIIQPSRQSYLRKCNI